jgi:GNAT superfamily N-acetyltransferase
MTGTATRNGFSVRAMRPEEIALALDWAAAEGWNPGFHDGHCFAAVDPQGFWLGELGAEPAATISVVNYDNRFAFLGFYIVRPDLRGRGYGWRTWQAAIAHARARCIGLDGVIAQQANYQKSGFALAYRNIRFGGIVKAPAPVTGVDGIVELGSVPFSRVLADDATVFPAPRASFLRAWIDAPGHVGRALIRDGKLAAWGVIRPARRGRKIGPLVADGRAAAESVVDALIGTGCGGEIFLDLPEPNPEGVALAQARGLAPVFETARMYRGSVSAGAVHRVFGVTTFELG